MFSNNLVRTNKKVFNCLTLKVKAKSNVEIVNFITSKMVNNFQHYVSNIEKKYNNNHSLILGQGTEAVVVMDSWDGGGTGPIKIF